ncbi:hypothetical protein PBAL39_01322 [Pedobacter sp. BAL39]|uniref:hypothetical protein n=1 Tax=Pedobacter sp. BAL39 TaxID=391596 RepID=UPI00015593A1|nr:hypothetical protein [Pedobacter sp. BAL39]EDM38213.1 hypothetical protein PBAL39_01322 [Pedobacter sp. BAL39]
MDERRVNILRDSRAEISKLQLLSAFFEQESVYKIYLRSQVIHQLFEQNEELDIDKLELFHVQFSASVIELLRKIKKNNEKNVTLLYDEIQLNKELMERMSDTVYTTKNYQLDQQKQSLKINQSLRKIFQVLSDHSEEFPFSKNINSFSSRFSKDFFFPISTQQLSALTDYDVKEMYIDVHASIHKKLMGMLCKYDFRTAFFVGLKSGQLIVEVYKFLDIDRHFLFFPSRNLFLFCDMEVIKDIDISNQGSEKERMIQELAYKNDRLESSAAAMKTFIPIEIIDLLDDNYIKISDINFLDHLNNFDVQANILKAMLKTDLF